MASVGQGTEVDSLYIGLGMDISGFQDTLDEATSSLESGSRKMKRWGQSMTQNVTAPIGAAVTALAGITQQTAKYAEQVQLASAQSGVGAENIQEIAFAAKQVSGVSFDAVQDGLKELSLRSAEAAEGTGEAQEAFKRLGISQSQLESLSTAQLFERVRQKMQGLTQQQRILTAEQVFGGEAGGKFAEVMGLSADELTRLRKQARKSGSVLSSSQTEALDQAAEGYNSLLAQIKGVGRQLAASLAPIFNNVLVPALGAAVRAVRGVVQWFADLSTTTKVAIATVTGIAAAIGPVLVTLGTLGTLLSGLPAALSAIGTAAVSAWGAITGPIGIVVGSVAAVGTAAYLVYDNWDGLTSFFGRLWEGVVSITRTSTDLLLAVLRGLWPRAKQFFLRGIQGLIGPLQDFAAWLGADALASQIGSFQGQLGQMVPGSVIEKNSAQVQKLTGRLQDQLASGMDAAQTTAVEAGQGIVDSVMGVVDSVTGAFRGFESAPDATGAGSGGEGGGESGAGSGGEGDGESGGAGLPSLQPIFSLVNNTSPDRVIQKTSIAKAKTTSMLGAVKRAGTSFVNTMGQGIGQTIGRILSFQKRVTSLGEVFRSVGGVIVQSLQKIVSKLVAAVAQAAVLKGIMSLFGIGSIGGIGGSFGSILGSIVPFAEGGIVTGPTLSLIGEAGPEAVIPLDKLQQMQGAAAGGARGMQEMQFRLRGQDMVASVDSTRRSSRNRGRRIDS